MTQFKNIMEIFNLLDKANSRKCGKKTCISFAASVFKGENSLKECPSLDQGTICRYQGGPENQGGPGNQEGPGNQGNQGTGRGLKSHPGKS
ncbi:MAG: hypothetical protein HQK66_14190 [Desulfamplus sp.]|nr:hypothetical protein [Desulfamplus sp.]